MRILLALVAWVLAAAVCAVDGQAGPYTISVTTEPAVVPVGRATLQIKVTDKDGKPVGGAEVRAIARMPGMFMGEREQLGVPSQPPGTYSVPAQFPMAGKYEVAVRVSGPAGSGQGVVEMSTGQASGGAETSAFPWIPVMVGLALVGLAAFVLVRMAKTGQRIDARPLLSRQVIIPILILGAAVAIAVFAVNRFRRPGAMTPIEAQVMDMNIAPPEGTLAVVLAPAVQRPFGASVRYSGQAAGFVEQSVVPRVAGVIEWMPVYVGGRVKKGDVIARLDTTQTEPEVAEKSASLSTAQEGVGAASAEYAQMLSGVSEARAEVSTARQSVGESQANVDAARQERQVAVAELESARSAVATARAELASAQADQRYWVEELARMQTLLNQGAVSRDEFQRARADAEKAAAQVRQAQEGVRSAESAVNAMQAGVRKADAEIVAATRRVAQVQAQVRAMEAKVRTAEAAANAARRRVGQARSGVDEARAGLRGAAAMQGYAAIRAEVDGVVVERLISPGVLVSPGQVILKIAQVAPIRLQANVPESDLDRVRVGNRVVVARRGGGSSVAARVTSVQPSVDAGARTGVVEAVLPNQDSAFLPGQFVSMEIQIGDERPRLVVPEAALQSGSFVWVAERIPGQEGRFTVQCRTVEVGDKSGEFVAILDGVNPGDQVVVQGGTNLRSGQTVTSSQRLPKTLRVEVSTKGFTPPTIQVDAGKSTRITFIRIDEENCGTEVVFPKLGITRELPLNKAVVVELPPQPEGELSFTCGMDMLRGKVVVR